MWMGRGGRCLSIPHHSGQSGAATGPGPGARCHQRLYAGDSGQPHYRWRPHAAAEAHHPRRPVPAAPASFPKAAMWDSPAGGCLDCWAHDKSRSQQAGSGRSYPGTTPGNEVGASLQDRREGWCSQPVSLGSVLFPGVCPSLLSGLPLPHNSQMDISEFTFLPCSKPFHGSPVPSE